MWLYDHFSHTSLAHAKIVDADFDDVTLCDQAFNPPCLGGKIIELAKFCFMNKRFETNLSFFSKPMIVSHCVWSFNSKLWIPNAMKKCIFSASIYIGQFYSLIQIFNNYGITKGLTFVKKQKVLSCFFWLKVIVKNNVLATHKWRIWRPGRMAWERLIWRFARWSMWCCKGIEKSRWKTSQYRFRNW